MYVSVCVHPYMLASTLLHVCMSNRMLLLPVKISALCSYDSAGHCFVFVKQSEVL